MVSLYGLIIKSAAHPRDGCLELVVNILLEMDPISDTVQTVAQSY